MKKRSLFAFVLAAAVFAVLVVSGCGGKNFVSPYAMKNNEHIQVPVIDQFVKNSSGKMFSTYCLINAGWATEVPAGGVGRWTVLARTVNGEIAPGFMVEYERNNANHDIGRIIVDADPDTVQELLVMDHGATVVANLEGREFAYDAKRFSKDKAYQVQVFAQKGTKVSDIDSFWKRYSGSTPGIRQFYDSAKFGSAVEKIRIGSPEYEALQKNFSRKLPYTYRMPNGEYVMSSFDEKEFRMKAVENNGRTVGQRFMKYWDVVLSPEPISMGIFNITSALNALRRAHVEDPSGYYANAKVFRKDTKPQFADQKQRSDEVVKRQNETIEALTGELYNLKSIIEKNSQ